MSNEARFDSVNVRTWNTKESPDSFPEVSDSEVAVPWLASRPSFGIAFSGGGTRSATATIGQLRALTTLGWTDQARYITANSGGSWTSTPYAFLPDHIDEARFLGPYISPKEMTDEKLLADEDSQSMESAIFHSKLIDPTEPERLFSLLKGDEGYASFVNEVFLKPFKLHDRKKFFGSHDAALNRILEGNPLLKPDDFYITRKNRPFLIVVGTMLTPFGEGYLIEATPLYIGVRNEHNVAAEKHDNTKRMLIGGGYVEPFGYDSYEPEQSVATEGRWEVRLKGSIFRFDWPSNMRYRFTLSDMIGMSSAAPHITLARKKIPDTVFPEFRHWGIDRQSVNTDTTLRRKSRELKHGDGGDIDNLAILPLLARRIENILVFVNTRSAFPEEPNCDDVTTNVLVDDVVSLFKPTEKLKHNVVIADGDAELSTLCREFAQRKKDGEPLVYCQRYTIKDNPRQGISGTDYAPAICWVYLDLTHNWVVQLPEKEGGERTDALKHHHGDFKHFPHFQTFGEQGPLLIDLDRERVRALSNLTAWTVFEKAPYIAEKLATASLTTEKRPADFE